MTREEEIGKAAEKFAFSDKTETPDYHNAINDFYYGAKWADKTMIEKVCEWLKENIDQDLVIYNNQSWTKRDVFIDKLKKAMAE